MWFEGCVFRVGVERDLENRRVGGGVRGKLRVFDDRWVVVMVFDTDRLLGFTEFRGGG